VVRRYFFDGGWFDALDVGVVDDTVHVLELPDGARLVVDRAPADSSQTARSIATTRTDLEAGALAKFAVISERDEGVTCDVAAYFHDGGQLAYQLRRHLVRSPWAVTFTLRGPLASRAELDARMDRIFGTLVFRASAAEPLAVATTGDPALYVCNDLAFELSPGGFRDHTVHELCVQLRDGDALELMIARAESPPGSGLAEAVRAHVEAEARRLPFHAVLGRREIRVAGREAIDVTARWAFRAVEYHARGIHVGVGGGRLMFAATAPIRHQAACDDYMARLVSTLNVHR
jgi:hypothetical protein